MRVYTPQLHWATAATGGNQARLKWGEAKTRNPLQQEEKEEAEEREVIRIRDSKDD